MTIKVTQAVNPLSKGKATEGPVLKNYVGFVVDESYSMVDLSKKVNQVMAEQLANVCRASYEMKQATLVSLFTFSSKVKTIYTAQHPANVDPYAHQAISQTALLDAVGHAISSMQGVRDYDNPLTSFLLVVITDGEENASMDYTQYTLARLIGQVQATGRWSIAFLGPRGSRRYITGLGIPEGNVEEWDATKEGLDVASVSTVSAVKTYYTGRAAGRTKTTSFYTDLSSVKTLNNMVDLAHLFKSRKVDREEDIAPFVERKFGKYEIGRAFYELTKPERVQSSKIILIEDKASGKLVGGRDARNLLGIPEGTGVTVRVIPGNHANYRVFIQSRSMNRKLVRGTTVLYEA